MEQTIGERQRLVWMAAGFSVVAATSTCGLGWQWVLLGSLLAMIYYIVANRMLPRDGLGNHLGKCLCVMAYLWMTLLLAWAACLADAAFPMVEGFPELGWVMLVLAAWSVKKGVAACGRCCGVLSLFLLILYVAVAAFAMPDMLTENLRPQPGWQEIFLALGLYLVPAAIWYMPTREEKAASAQRVVWVLPIFAAGLAFVTAGVLSPQLAREQAVPLYNLARSVSVFGVIERIEPLLSVAMVMGIFALMSGLVGACQTLGQKVYPWKWHGVLVCSLAAAGMYAVRVMPTVWLGVGNGLIFGVLPILACGSRRKTRGTPQRNV